MARGDEDRGRPQRDWLSPKDPKAEKLKPKPKFDGQPKDGGKGKEDEKGRNGGTDGKQEGDGKEHDDKKDAKQKPMPWWPFVAAGLVLVVFVGTVLWIIFRPRPDVWTDDAYVSVHYSTIAPRVSGQVVRVPVEENQLVKAGDLLAELDPSDYRTAVASAEAAVERDRAQVGDVSANVSRQPAIIDEQQASVDAARARLGFAEADARRFTNLATTGAGTNQQHQQADATLQQDQAQLKSALASLDAAKKQLDVLKAQQKASEAGVAADRARLEQANLDLGYTRIPAPLDGMVGERSVQVGNYVGPGATIMTVVPLDRVYIDANYRETDLLHVRSGQPVTIHVDAYDIDLDGTVDSVPPASGASFAPIAPNNATGNYTKIVQRLAVKIDVVPGQPLAKLLRVGFSVETTIHTGLENVVGEQRDTSHRVTAH